MTNVETFKKIIQKILNKDNAIQGISSLIRKRVSDDDADTERM
jgi:hypothetical protein